MFKKVPGTKDILPEEVYRWKKIEEISRNIFSVYNYQEIRPPIIEESALFDRSLGESTEIIQKQMFLITPVTNTVFSKGDSKICNRIKKEKVIYALRPEGTAPVVRAYIENNLDKTAGFVKLYYIGPMFRRERPQKGRQRQFNHIGCEVIGSPDASVDVEVVSLADRLLKAFSIEGYKIKINSLGCIKDKKELTGVLRKALKEKFTELCDDCRVRFKNNILRILDCKNKACQEVINKLGIQFKHLCFECESHFSKVKEGLDSLKIDYEITPHLVRGLDYYTRTVFEITHEDLGAQDAIGAGGRYDNLVSDLGGPCIGAMGFAFGIERLLLFTGSQTQATRKNLVYIITLGQEARRQGLKLLDNLRKMDIACDTDYEGKSLKGAMRAADTQKARYVLIIGEDELKKNVVTLKDMASGEQQEIENDKLTDKLLTLIEKDKPHT